MLHNKCYYECFAVERLDQDVVVNEIGFAELNEKVTKFMYCNHKIMSGRMPVVSSDLKK